MPHRALEASTVRAPSYLPDPDASVKLVGTILPAARDVKSRLRPQGLPGSEPGSRVRHESRRRCPRICALWYDKAVPRRTSARESASFAGSTNPLQVQRTPAAPMTGQAPYGVQTRGSSGRKPWRRLAHPNRVAANSRAESGAGAGRGWATVALHILNTALGEFYVPGKFGWSGRVATMSGFAHTSGISRARLGPFASSHPGRCRP